MENEQDWPKSLEEVIERILSEMTEEAKKKFGKTSEEDLIMCHWDLGAWIRNNFGLWLGNKELLESCGSKDIHPDSASSVIIKALWEKLQK